MYVIAVHGDVWGMVEKVYDYCHFGSLCGFPLGRKRRTGAEDKSWNWFEEQSGWQKVSLKKGIVEMAVIVENLIRMVICMGVVSP